MSMILIDLTQSPVVVVGGGLTPALLAEYATRFDAPEFQRKIARHRELRKKYLETLRNGVRAAAR